MPNQLANSSSLYLRQHRDNPVDWMEWCETAFEKAARLNRPVFLSVGYSSCHWCHVMAHESFENQTVADFLNEHFVSIKVDREERPDVDEQYMAAVQLTSGRGGWPMSVFLTPGKKPFFAGTYFPAVGRGQIPSFLELINQIAYLWKTEPSRIEQSSQELSAAVKSLLEREVPTKQLASLDLVDATVSALRQDFDPVHGGFGTAPKFPPHAAIELLLKHDREKAVFTLEKMCAGGIHDHVGGGFHRYSTDEAWHLPHFEKMLYDNALMLYNLGLADVVALRVAADGIVNYLHRELTRPDGLLGSAIDADSEGEEGAFYTWAQSEVRAVIGVNPDFERAFQIRPAGNFFDEATGNVTGRNVLAKETAGEFKTELDKLLAVRTNRPHPLFDHKPISGWNGLAIAGLAVAGEREFASRLGKKWIDIYRKCEYLPHLDEGAEGFLDDHAFMAWGLWHAGFRSESLDLTIRAIKVFFDEKRNLFCATSREHEQLLGRSAPVFDQPIPSANAIMLRLLVRHGMSELAQSVAKSLSAWVALSPHGTEAAALGIQEAIEATPSQQVHAKLIDDHHVAFNLPSGHHLSQIAPQNLEWSIDGDQAHTTEPLNERTSLEIQLCTDEICLPWQSVELNREGR